MEKQELAKIAISTEADAAMVQALDRVNRNNPGGRVTKAEIASWFILKASNALSEEIIEEVQLAHFDQVSYLVGLVRGLKQSGRDSLTPEEVSRFQSVIKQKNGKSQRAKKTATTEENPTI